MKRLGTIAVIAGLLLATALFYRLEAQEEQPAPEPAVSEPRPEPVVDKTEPEPVTQASAGSTLKLRAGSSHGYLASGSDGDLYAAVDIEAREVQGGTRPPLNLAVVIDRSGSMRGDKLEYAKRAAMHLVDQLQAQDRLSLVSYASDVSVDISSQLGSPRGKAMMRGAIERISSGGGTNIAHGYRRGFSQIAPFTSDETVSRVVLLSDGRPTVGITNPHTLEKMARDYLGQGVSLTTMGVGLDYNEDLMAAMADRGAGNYHFIDQPNTVVSILDSELDGLAQTVARNTSVVITLPEGVGLEELYGFSHRRVDDAVLVSLAEFRAGESKNILMKLRADAGEPGQFPVMEVSLSYKDLLSDAQKNDKVALSAVATDDVDKTRSEVNVEVISRVQQVEVANSLKEAMAAYESGDQSQAQQVIRRQRRTLQKARKKYKLKEPSFSKAEAELKKTESDVSKFGASSNDGKRMIKEKKARGRMILRDANVF